MVKVLAMTVPWTLYWAFVRSFAFSPTRYNFLLPPHLLRLRQLLGYTRTIVDRFEGLGGLDGPGHSAPSHAIRAGAYTRLYGLHAMSRTPKLRDKTLQRVRGRIASPFSLHIVRACVLFQ